MPVVDFRCPNHHIESHFIPARLCGNDHPESESSVCSQCQQPSERIYDSTTFTSVGFPEIVVHLNTRTGEYSIPGSSDDELPDADYRRISITSMRQYERVRRGIEAVELEKAQYLQAVERAYFDQTAKSHRESQREKIESAIAKGGYWTQYTDERGITRTRWAAITPRARQLFDLASAYTDARREMLRRERESGRPNVHSRILEHRSSEQSVVSGAAKRPDLPDIAKRLDRRRRET